MEEFSKKTNYIGSFFRQYISKTGFDRRFLAKKLEFDYANNDRMICAYLVKKDYLWKQSEVEKWCNALSIKANVKENLISKAGKKDKDYNLE